MEPQRTVIGLDIGGTKIAAAVLRGRPTVAETPGSPAQETPQVVASFTQPTDQSSARACLDGLTACVARAVARAAEEDRKSVV
jgi:predicted NBD/HSP70 family sugar kinase